MTQPPLLSTRIAAWTREAVALWGHDWPRISAYIEKRMTALDASQKRDLEREAALTLVDADAKRWN